MATKRFVISYNPNSHDISLLDTGRIEADVNLDYFNASCSNKADAMFLKHELDTVCDYLNYQHEELERKDEIIRMRERQLQVAIAYLISDTCCLSDGQLKEIQNKILEVENE